MVLRMISRPQDSHSGVQGTLGQSPLIPAPGPQGSVSSWLGKMEMRRFDFLSGKHSP